MTETKPAIDYAGVYDSYWGRPDRFGKHSFQDGDAVAGEILRALGSGRILDVGSGMGLLVRTLLAHGADAQGLDVSPLAVAQGNALAPGRFHLGSILALPFPDRHFDVVVSTDCLEHLAEADVPRALQELHRVTRRGVYLRLATTPDRDGHWHLTVRPRSWWEEQLFAAGFRKHPRAMAIVPYERLEQDDWQITLIHERVPAAALARHPLAALLQARDLHMDMLRESGRRSDAHVARYQLAAGFVRPGDVVLDVACGLGYGTAVLAANSAAASLWGVDLDADAIAYAADLGGEHWPQVQYRIGDATRLDWLPDESVDFIASFETLEHVPDPRALLAEFDRVLKPSGRLLVSVPNQWVDDTGRDPNPHHLHVYDWSRLHREMAARFAPEAVWAQTAGGGMKLPHAPRRIQRAALADPTATPAEWWLCLAMKSPLGRAPAGYEETSYPPAPGTQRPHITAFGRDYDNPWLVKAIVARGHRAIDPGLLAQWARETLAAAAPTSADAGAALCVLAYRLLDDAAAPAAAIDQLQAQIDRYVAATPANPNCLRWQISLLYVAARLQLCCGRRELARDLFRRCGAMDAKAYSPVLGTKTVDALLQAGRLAAVDADAAAARTDLGRALAEAQRLLQGDWHGILGDPAQPVAFGLVETADVIDVAAEAANELLQLQARRLRPGFAVETASHGRRHQTKVLETLLQSCRESAASLYASLQISDRQLREAREATAAASARIDELQARIAALTTHQEVQLREIDELRQRIGLLGALRWLGRRLAGRR